MLMSQVNDRLYPFIASFFNIHRSATNLQRCLVVVWPVSRETAAVSVHMLCTPYSHAPVYSVTSFKAINICRVRVCLAVTCHRHFWQNDRDLLR